jgi:hypothetical protein
MRLLRSMVSFQATAALRIFNDRRGLASLLLNITVFVPQRHALPPYCVNV